MNQAIEKICRACESPDVLLNLADEENRSLLRKFRACIDIQVINEIIDNGLIYQGTGHIKLDIIFTCFQLDIGDRLPKHICSECVSSVEGFYRFKIKCEYIDLKLRESIRECAAKNVPIPVAIFTGKSEQAVIVGECIKPEVGGQDGSDDVCDNEEYVVYDEEYTNVDHLADDETVGEEMAANDGYSGSEEEGRILFFTENNTEDVESLEQHTILSVNEMIIEDPDEELDEEQLVEECEDQPADNPEHEPEADSLLIEIAPHSLCKPKIEPTSFACDTCNASFTSFPEYNQHKKSHGKQRYQCDICERWFSKRYYIKAHMAIHAGIKHFECLLCPKRYSNQGNLDRHVRVFHDKQRDYDCDMCGKSFSQSTTLRQHRSTHLEERNFECEVCQKSFKTAEYLKLHKHRHLPIELRPKRPAHRPIIKKPIKKTISYCKLCGKKSNSTALHQSHMRTHTGEKPYECEFCQQRFSFYQSLKSHLLLHTGEKPYKCDDCGMTFRQIGHLHGHRLTHTGQKNHKCDICSKTFALRGNLTVHMRMHTGDTPHNCEYCPKSFYDSNGLKRHMKMHARKSHIRDSVFGVKAEANEDEQEYYISETTEHATAVHDESEIIALYMTEGDCDES